ILRGKEAVPSELRVDHVRERFRDVMEPTHARSPKFVRRLLLVDDLQKRIAKKNPVRRRSRNWPIHSEDSDLIDLSRPCAFKLDAVRRVEAGHDGFASLARRARQAAVNPDLTVVVDRCLEEHRLTLRFGRNRDLRAVPAKAYLPGRAPIL